MENCVFCKIINGEIPSDKVYEDDDFLVVISLLLSQIPLTFLASRLFLFQDEFSPLLTSS